MTGRVRVPAAGRTEVLRMKSGSASKGQAGRGGGVGCQHVRFCAWIFGGMVCTKGAWQG